MSKTSIFTHQQHDGDVSTTTYAQTHTPYAPRDVQQITRYHVHSPFGMILGLVDLVGVGVGVARVVLFGGYLVVVYLVVVSRVAENM